jgi:hypothetical protein
MASEVVVKKGYTFKAKTWENDGDNNQINTHTFKTKEECDAAIKLIEFTKQFSNECDLDFEEEFNGFYMENPDISCIITSKYDWMSDYDIAVELLGTLLGRSEWYTIRCFDWIEITYSPKEIKTDVYKTLR